MTKEIQEEMDAMFSSIDKKNEKTFAAAFERFEKLIIKQKKSASERREFLATKNSAGQTLLHVATLKNSVPMVRFLLSTDFPIDAVNTDNKTAEVIADEMNHQEIKVLLNTGQYWRSIVTGFNLNRVVDVLPSAVGEIKPASGCEKVLLIGSTGAGKSTLLNYLLGARYRINTGSGGKISATIVTGKEHAKVGHGMSSQTLYPQVAWKEGSEFVYCDLAGLCDNRGNEKRIIAASSAQMLSQLPGGTRGVLVLLDLPGFQAARGAAFKDTALALAKMTQNNPDLLFEKVYFVITKMGKVVVTAEGIIEDFVTPLIDAMGMPEDAGEEAVIKMLERMQNNAARILVSDIADYGASRNEIEGKLNALTPVDSKLFDFTHHDGAQQAFNDALSTVTNRFLDQNERLYKKIPQAISAEKKIQEDKQTIIDSKEGEVKTKQADITKLGQEGADLNTDFDQLIKKMEAKIAEKRDTILVNKNKMDTLTTDIANYNIKISDLEGTVGALDTWDVVRLENGDLSYASNKRCEDSTKEHQFEYVGKHALGRIEYDSSSGCGSRSYTLIRPILTGETKIENGKTVRIFKHDEKPNGYIGIFKDTVGLTRAGVHLFTRKTYMYAVEIKKYREEIVGWTNKIRLDSDERRNLNKENDRLDGEIISDAQLISNYRINKKTAAHRKEMIKILSEQLQKEIKGIQAEINELTKQKNTSVAQKKELEKEEGYIKLDFKYGKNLYGSICTAAGYLALSDKIFTQLQNEFKKEYQEICGPEVGDDNPSCQAFDQQTCSADQGCESTTQRLSILGPNAILMPRLATPELSLSGHMLDSTDPGDLPVAKSCGLPLNDMLSSAGNWLHQQWSGYYFSRPSSSTLLPEPELPWVAEGTQTNTPESPCYYSAGGTNIMGNYGLDSAGQWYRLDQAGSGSRSPGAVLNVCENPKPWIAPEWSPGLERSLRSGGMGMIYGGMTKGLEVTALKCGISSQGVRYVTSGAHFSLMGYSIVQGVNAFSVCMPLAVSQIVRTGAEQTGASRMTSMGLCLLASLGMSYWQSEEDLFVLSWMLGHLGYQVGEKIVSALAQQLLMPQEEPPYLDAIIYERKMESLQKEYAVILEKCQKMPQLAASFKSSVEQVQQQLQTLQTQGSATLEQVMQLRKEMKSVANQISAQPQKGIASLMGQYGFFEQVRSRLPWNMPIMSSELCHLKKR